MRVSQYFECFIPLPSDGKSTVSLIEDPLYMFNCFSLAVFKILFVFQQFFLWFGCTCIWVHHNLSLIELLRCYISYLMLFMEVFTISSSNILSASFSPLSFWGYHYLYIAMLCRVLQIFEAGLCSYFSFFFLLFLRLNDLNLSVSSLILSFACSDLQLSSYVSVLF